jgi:hypothetical protein
LNQQAFEFTNVDALERSSLTVRRMFEANRSVKDPNIIRTLLSNAHTEIKETILMYKTCDHVKQLLLADAEEEDSQIQRHAQIKNQSKFMDKFIHGEQGNRISVS